MRTLNAVTAIPVVVVVSLSLTAGYLIEDVHNLPMHWSRNWVPTAYAPKWIGLALLPALGMIAMASLLLVGRAKAEKEQVRDVTIVGSILVLSHSFYLYLIKQWLESLAT